ncbi:hypothetical protein [Silvimonas soli]|uniref:hypothetical protein n=1 Tax=Silvimonas soli TaxID=2980100 RepID=UPI0024B36A37|nr:hypothetical protein [Silvimonas soli]
MIGGTSRRVSQQNAQERDDTDKKVRDAARRHLQPLQTCALHHGGSRQRRHIAPGGHDSNYWNEQRKMDYLVFYAGQ